MLNNVYSQKPILHRNIHLLIIFIRSSIVYIILMWQTSLIILWKGTKKIKTIQNKIEPNKIDIF